jgi:hypothetical protein
MTETPEQTPPPEADEAAEPAASAPDRVECPVTKDPVVRGYIIAFALIGLGVWCLTDQKPKPPAWDMEHINEVLNYVFNNIGPFLFIPIGLIQAVRTFLLSGKVLVADSEGIGYEGKDKISWPNVKTVDAGRLQKKGYLYLHTSDGEKFTIDTWRHHNSKELVALIERMVPPDKQTLN